MLAHRQLNHNTRIYLPLNTVFDPLSLDVWLVAVEVASRNAGTQACLALPVAEVVAVTADEGEEAAGPMAAA